jgi:endonuclease/exonuclease/phosphatase (EEP) superfamily protein YafD
MDVTLLVPLSGDYPIVLARLCGLASGCVMVITAHPPRPGPQRWRRNKLLAALAGYAQKATRDGDRVIAAGDFNVTAFSADFAVFAQAGLIDTALGRGYPSTWPLWLGPKSPLFPAGLPGLGVGIDQVLVSPGIGVVQRWLGPDIGSDHWPLFVELKIP